MADNDDALEDTGQGAASGAATGAMLGPYGALIGGAIGGIGGLVGNLTSQGSKDADMAAKQAALQRLLGIDAPSAQDLMINLEKEQVAGQINPQLQGTVSEGPSAYQGISTNPQLRDAQMNALTQLQQLGNTGLTASDRAALMQIQNQTSSQAQALNKSALANAAQRGMAGGGAELAARLIGSQGAANSGAQAGLNVASQAQQKALQAMSSAGALGSQMEGQQFGEEAQKAAAADAISRFNTANRQNVIGANVGAQNQAQYANLNNAQSVANANTNIANEQAIKNSQAQQQAYQDALQKAQAGTGQSNVVGNQFGQNATDNSNMWSGIGNAANSILTAYGNGQMKPATSSNAGQGTNTSSPEEKVNLDNYNPSPINQGGALNGPAMSNGNYASNEW